MTVRAVWIARARRLASSAEGRELRTRAGLSLADVAAVADVTPAAVHAWENARYLPRGEHAVRYARLLWVLRGEMP